MVVRHLICLAMSGAVWGYVCVSGVGSDEPRQTPAEPSGGLQSPAAGNHSIDLARERATVSLDIYAATLRMLHQRYFHQDKRVLPARAMHDIFADIESQSNVKARWISASLKPMSIDHTPESEFEKQAARAIADGSPHLEVVEDGYYRRAIAIPLTGGCLHCHEGMFQNHKSKSFAGLVISVPLQHDRAALELPPASAK